MAPAGVGDTTALARYNALMETLVSTEDRSVNFVSAAADGAIEARYVRRGTDYFIAYLSSHTGCKMGCRFCHLTATRQSGFTPVTTDGFFAQAKQVLRHYRDNESVAVPVVNFNWMARGEAFANPAMLHDPKLVFDGLARLAAMEGLAADFKVSTIFPRKFDKRILVNDYSQLPATIYYSLYSMDPAFRNKWLPGAMAPEEALDMLAFYQAAGGGEIVLHWTFIKGQNDSVEAVESVCRAVKSRGLKARFNLVRYNPFSSAQGEESDAATLSRNFLIMSESLGHPASKIIPRVGYDVKASCGMFVVPEKLLISA